MNSWYDPVGSDDLATVGVCAVRSCDRPKQARHLCRGHLRRLYKHGDVRPQVPLRTNAPKQHLRCEVDGCGRHRYSKRLCEAHYQRLVDTGDVRADVPFRQKPSGQCGVSGCDQPVGNMRTGWCNAHQQRWHRYGDVLADVPLRVRQEAGGRCKLVGCDATVVARGWCAGHYARWRKYGDALATSKAEGDPVTLRLRARQRDG